MIRWLLVIYTISPAGEIQAAQPWHHYEHEHTCMLQADRMRNRRINPNLFPACVLIKETK